MNNVILTGRLTKDPEVRRSQDGMAIASYTLAVDGFKKDETNYIMCKAFKGNAEFAEKYLKKGMKILIEGSIKTGSYKNKDGNTVYTTDVIVSSHEFCESKKDSAPAEAYDPSKIENDISDEIPFV